MYEKSDADQAVTDVPPVSGLSPELIADDVPSDEIDEIFVNSFSFKARAQVLAVLGTLPSTGFPIWWGLLANERHYDLLSFGLIQTAQISGWVVINLVMLLFLRRLRLNLYSAGVFVVMGLGYFSVLLIHDVRLLIVAFGIQAAASGSTVALSGIYLGLTRNSERQFAIQGTLITITVAIVFTMLPRLYGLIGNAGIQIFYGALMLLCACMMIGLPARGREKPKIVFSEDDQKRPMSIWWAGVPILIAFSLYSNFLTVIYNYSEKLGGLRGLPIATTGTIVSAGMVVGSLTGAIGIMFGKRGGKIVPMFLSSLVGIAMFILLRNTQSGLPGYAAGMMLFGVLYNFLHSYIYAQMMDIDPRGRVIVVSSLISAIAGVALAGIVTAVSVHFGVPAVLWIGLGELLALPFFAAASVQLARPETVSRLLRRRG